MILELMIGAAAAGATYAARKKKKAGTGESVVAAAVVGAGAGVATGIATAIFWPALLIGGPLAAGYWWVTRKDSKQVGDGSRKMIGPGS